MVVAAGCARPIPATVRGLAAAAAWQCMPHTTAVLEEEADAIIVLGCGRVERSFLSSSYYLVAVLAAAS